MQYLISVIDDNAGLDTGTEAADIDVFNDRLRAEGHWVFAGGLGSPSTATVVDNRGAEAVISDGPFAESKEHLAGFWIIEAPDLDLALKLATDGSKACNRKLEVRPFLPERGPQTRWRQGTSEDRSDWQTVSEDRSEERVRTGAID